MDLQNQNLLIKSYLSDIHPFELVRKISEFRNLNVREMSEQELMKQIDNTFSISLHDDITHSMIRTDIRMIPKGSSFFRIRTLINNNIPNDNFRKESDLWNPPAECSKMQRLNKENESLLYTSLDLLTAIEETKIKNNELFGLIIYTSKEDIKVNCIGLDKDYEGFNDDEKLKLKIIDDFLKDEFSRDVGEGTEFLYRVSEIIAKTYFDLPPRVIQDAWAYPSIKNKNRLNVCFRPDIAHDLLELEEVSLVTYTNNSSDYELNVKARGKDIDLDGNINFEII